MPKKKSININITKAILIEKITDLEENQNGGVRFLPVKMLLLTFGDINAFSINIIDDTYGKYPCCTYIYPDDFNGFIGDSIIFGLWRV